MEMMERAKMKREVARALRRIVAAGERNGEAIQRFKPSRSKQLKSEA